MTDSKRFAVPVGTVPVGTHHSFTIELECLVAWLPTGDKDTDNTSDQGLPPLLRINPSSENEETVILNRISSTLRRHGIPSVPQPSKPVQPAASGVSTTDAPLPPEIVDPSVWVVGTSNSVKEFSVGGYQWQPLKIRSPVMWSSKESFKEIQVAVELLTTSFRLHVNPTCNFGVHIDNGGRSFPADVVKRIESFLWTADPILSRLHAPWRRIHEGSRSIRLDSNLAHGATAEEMAKKWEDGWPEGFNPLPVTDFLDTTQEELGYGGSEGSSEIARWRDEVGSFMTLGDDINDINRNDDKDSDDDHDDNNGDDTGGDSSSVYTDNEWASESNGNVDNSPLVSEPQRDLTPDFDGPEYRLPPLKQVTHEWNVALEKDYRTIVPPDPNTLDRNIGWVRWDKLQDEELVKWIFDYCQETYGHMKPYKLAITEQVLLMMLVQCIILFGHEDVDELSAEEEHEVLIACAPYIACRRTAWEWNPEVESWKLAWRRVGNILHHPAARREIKIDAPAIIQNFENMAELTDLNGEDSEQGLMYLSQEGYQKAIETNRGIEEMFEGLKDYVKPVDPNFTKNLQDPLKGFCHEGIKLIYNSSPSLVKSHDADEEEEEEFPRNGWLDLMAEIREFGRCMDMIKEEEANPPLPYPTSPSSFYSRKSSGSSEISSIPPEWYALTERPETDEPGTPYQSEIPNPKLQPYDADDLSTPYKAVINRYVHIADEEWDRIGALPPPTTTTNPPVGAKASRAIEPAAAGPHGVAEISSCETAAAAAALLRRTGVQLNYDFAAYAPGSGNQNQNQNQSRGIGFREAGGSLDATWIAMWTRICAGIASFAQCADVALYLEVLDNLWEQDKRDCRRMAARGAAYAEQERDEAERYDVCDLLEDMGLFPEAAWIRIRERERGPPR